MIYPGGSPGDDIWDNLRNYCRLTVELQEEIQRVYGEQGKKAVKAVNDCRVKKYLDFFVVVGSSNEYVVEENFCTCRAHMFRKGLCWHVIAVRIAKATGCYENVDEWYQETLKGEPLP